LLVLQPMQVFALQTGVSGFCAKHAAFEHTVLHAPVDSLQRSALLVAMAQAALSLESLPVAHDEQAPVVLLQIGLFTLMPLHRVSSAS
jgi:hypothetical protein